MKIMGESTISRRSLLKAAGVMGMGSILDGNTGILHSLADSTYITEGKEPEEKAIPAFCAMCGPNAGCGIYAIVKNGKFIRIEGMKDSPINRGRTCPKAHAAPQWVYSPQRLRYPLKRVGQRGEGKFKRIGWDEALDIIAGKLKEQKAKYGPESLGVAASASRSYRPYMRRFLAVHGSPNYGHSGICSQPKSFPFRYTLGSTASADIANTGLLLIWGKQPIYGSGPKGGIRELLETKTRGAKIVAIKPSMEPDAALADMWVPIRPGTDAALALGMLNVIIGEKLYDAPFVEKWTYGFDKLEGHIQKYTPQWAESITGVTAGQIRDVARLYATTKPASIDLGNGFEHMPSSNNAVRAVAILIAISGNLDRRGGNVFSGKRGSVTSGASSLSLLERYTQDSYDRLLVPEFPRALIEAPSTIYYKLFESVITGKPYPIRTIIAPGSQPTVTTRGTKNVIEALKKVDFYVVIDVTRTSDMDYADVVIPVTTMYETDHPFGSSGNWTMARDRVIEPLGDYKSDIQFWIELGVKMGYGKDFWNGDLDKCMNEQLRPLGLTMEELRAKPTGIISKREPRTYEKYEKVFSFKSLRLSKAPYLPQKKVAIYNTTFEEAGFNPLPEWVEPPEGPTATPELLEKYPLILSDFHTSKVYTASWLRNVPYLREVMPDPTLQIHPDAAKPRGIKDGDWVRVQSPHGSMILKAEVIRGIRPDTVMAYRGWWQGCEELGKADYPVLGGANVNSMYSTDQKAYDPIVVAMSSQTLVHVTKA